MNKKDYKNLLVLLKKLEKEINKKEMVMLLEDGDKKRLDESVDNLVGFCEVSVESIEAHEE